MASPSDRFPMSTSNEDEKNLVSEVVLMRRIKNPYTIRLFGVYRDPKYYYLVQVSTHSVHSSASSSP